MNLGDKASPISRRNYEPSDKISQEHKLSLILSSEGSEPAGRLQRKSIISQNQNGPDSYCAPGLIAVSKIVCSTTPV